MMKRAESFICKKDNILETIGKAKQLIEDVKEQQRQYLIEKESLKQVKEILRREKDDIRSMDIDLIQ